MLLFQFLRRITIVLTVISDGNLKLKTKNLLVNFHLIQLN
jgi:hypothetical protein